MIRGATASHALPDMGWGSRTGGRLAVIETPGDHRSVLGTYVEALADRLVVAMREGVDALDRFAGPRGAHPSAHR